MPAGNPAHPHSRLALRVLALTQACLLLAACAGSSTLVPKADQDALAKYRSGAYAPETANPPVPKALRLTSTANEPEPWAVTLVQAPAGQGRQPVVVFLPALGEKSDSPIIWVEHWARNGYPVLVVQPLAEDAEAWSSPAARSGDFDRVARERFAPSLVEGRVRRLAGILAQLRRGAPADGPLATLDWDHMVVAGADLGAMTVQSLVARSPAELAAIGWPGHIAAAVMFSPYADREPAPAGATAPAHPPVLMVSAPEDIDAYGVVTDAGVRRLAFDRLGSGEGYYLQIDGVTHHWLEGYESVQQDLPALAHERQSPEGPMQPPNRRSSGPPRREGMAPVEELDEDEAKNLAAGRTAREAAVKSISRALTRLALGRESARAVSLAFLDATARQSAAAGHWLADSAVPWLAPGDRLKHRP